MKEEKHIVIGANGNAGNAIVEKLVSLNKKVITITRDGIFKNKEIASKVEQIKGDIMDVEKLLLKLSDVSHIYNAVNIPLWEWKDKLMKVTDNFIELADRLNAKLMVVDNLFMYNKNITKMREDSPTNPPTKKGKLRLEVSKKYIKSSEDKGFDLVILRGSNFYGPKVVNSVLGDRLFLKVLNDEYAMIFGDFSQDHAYTNITDYAEAMVSLALSTNKHQIYHAPNDSPIKLSEIVKIIEKELKRPVKYKNPNKIVMKLVGLFNKLAREYYEMLYQFEQPFLVDHSRYSLEYTPRITPIEKGISETIKWYQSYTDYNSLDF